MTQQLINNKIIKSKDLNHIIFDYSYEITVVM